MSILAIAGDIGGLAALIPVINKIKDRVTVVEHRDLPQKLDFDVNSVTKNSAKELILNKKISSIIWTTSVADTTPLEFARLARSQGIPVYCLLDNWMNYKKRMEIDGKETFIPDYYFMMDELAKSEAIKDGIPENNLLVTGQPALAKIADRRINENQVRLKILEKFNAPPTTKIISFVSEPAEMDQGACSQNPNFRGYTEKTVLEKFLNKVQEYSNQIVILILPHPREDESGILEIWKNNCRDIKGGIYKDIPSNELIKISDGVSGMASILLFEGWLQGKPTISMQPNLLREDLKTLKKRQGVVFLSNPDQWQEKVDQWMQEVQNPQKDSLGLKSLKLHIDSVQKIVEILTENTP